MRIIAALVLLTLGLVACGKDDATSATSTVASASPTPACISESELTAHRDSLEQHLMKTTNALLSFNLDAAVTQVRLAASEARAIGDAVADVDPTIEAHFSRSADALDSAATSLGDGDISGATSYMKQSLNEVNQGVDALDVSTYC
jgi:hypothetical protein